MAKRKYLSLDGLIDYDNLIKEKISDSDNTTLESAKTYADEAIKELITVVDIDTICGGTISYAEDVMF